MVLPDMNFQQTPMLGGDPSLREGTKKNQNCLRDSHKKNKK